MSFNRLRQAILGFWADSVAFLLAKGGGSSSPGTSEPGKWTGSTSTGA